MQKGKDMKKMYVTYHWLEMHGNRSNLKAIECKNKWECIEVYQDIISLHGIRNVRMNFSGRLTSKNPTIISHEDYLSGKYYNM